MGSDMAVALGRATSDGHTLFAQNSSRQTQTGQCLCLTPPRQFSPGEKLRTQHLEIPQARQTYAVLGSKPGGLWGYTHGLNEHHVAAGCIALPTTLTCPQPGLLGGDLVRLLLERSSSARQAVDLLTDLIKQYGHGAYPGCPAEFERDNAFLIADPVEAYAVETAGPHWVYQEIQEVRAVSGVRVVHQDWDRISCGFASHAITRAWWPEDGSKVDFGAALAHCGNINAAGMRRWGRATILLEENNSQIDLPFLRRFLCDHGKRRTNEMVLIDFPGDADSICQHPRGLNSYATVASFLADLGQDATQATHAWCAFGVPCTSVFFPIFLDGELPHAFVQDDGEAVGAGFGGRLSRLVEQNEQAPGRLIRVRERFAQLQARFDQETEEFLAETSSLKKNSAHIELHRQASMFMQHNLEIFEEAYADALLTRTHVAVRH